MMRAFYILCFLCTALQAYSTHNRAGEITYVQIDDLTIEATITTWTKTSSRDVDRDSLLLFWGDGSSSWVLRTNGNGEGEELENDIKRNLYTARHTYAGRGTFTMFMFDPNRNGGILNVSFPNSVNVPFYVESTFTLLNTQFQGFNNSVQLLQPPVDVGCVGKTFVHNPNGFDVDEDSLSYALVVPLQDSGSVVPLYEFPDEINPGVSNQISLDPETGTFTWRSPQRAGEYNIAIEITEWRNGRIINVTRRDMQILIQNCDNEPPVIDVENEICVVAGETLDIPFIVTDPDVGQRVKVSALGGPFILDTDFATLTIPDEFVDPPVTASINWQTTCDHISPQFYTIVLKATDNFFDSTGLSTLEVVRIKVVAPSPENLETSRKDDNIIVNWDAPYFCEDAPSPEFLGFTIYRRQGSLDVPLDTCNPGLRNSGYIPIAFSEQNIVNDRYEFVDLTAEKGISYCYRIVAEFGQISPGGNPFNLFESLHSNESCIFLSRGLPILLNVDIESTDLTDGIVGLRWAQPLFEDLDTIMFPGPYRYEVERSTGITGMDFQPVPGAQVNFTTWSPSPDSLFTDIDLNTLENGFNYRIAFYVNGDFNTVFCYSPTASTVRLSAGSGDRAILLSWDEIVPWQNVMYVVERENNMGGFDSVGITSTQNFIDRGLINEREYCYRIKALGEYAAGDLPKPLINYSQTACAVTMDTIGPCQLSLSIDNPCTVGGTIADPSTAFNSLTWTNPLIDCEDSDDAIGYRIYFSENSMSDLQLIEEINTINRTQFDHRGPNDLAGCYAVTAIDSSGNESVFSDIICIDNCPEIDIPNAFTPNGDGDNELFRLRRALFLDNFSFEIFTSWGVKIFETTSVDFTWDGTLASGDAAPTGTYYYVCSFQENRVSAIPEETTLSGFIHLLR